MSGFIPPNIRALSRPGAPALPEKRSSFKTSEIGLLVSSVALGILLFPKSAIPVKKFLGFYPYIGSLAVLFFSTLILANYVFKTAEKRPIPQTPPPLTEKERQSILKLNRVENGLLDPLSPRVFETDKPTRYEKKRRNENLRVTFVKGLNDPLPQCH
ncbi:MAG: hypothetical protein KDK62_01785 [Chlamydiia bacterium]|nr:hypothetical protein [Chlamydiia bacterium]